MEPPLFLKKIAKNDNDAKTIYLNDSKPHFDGT